MGWPQPLACVGRAVAAPGDTPAMVAQKTAMVLCEALGAVGCLVCGVTGTTEGNLHVQVLGGMMPFYLAALACLFRTRALTQVHVSVVSVVSAVAVTWYDLAVLPVDGWRGWGFFVVLFDAMIIARAPRRIRVGVVAWVAVWFLTTASERMFRWGLFDLPGSTDYEKRVFVCDKPPCAAKTAGVYLGVIPLAILLLDYKVTSSFALALAAEKAKIERVVCVAQKVASCLAHFDLDSAEAELRILRAADVPLELLVAYARLLGNLRRYRPYLPQAVVAADDDEAVGGDDAFTQRTSPKSSLRSGSEKTCGSDSDSKPQSTDSLPPSLNTLQHTPGSSVLDSIAVDLCATPDSLPPRMHPRTAPVLRHLTKLRGSLLLAACDLAPDARPDLDAYVAAHAAYLTDMMQCINSTRGVMANFCGDRVWASYNTVRRAAAHATNALDAARTIGDCKATKHGAHVAVVTGALLFGNLGNEASTSPNILSAMVDWLPQMITVGRELGEGVVCSAGTFGSVSLVYPLRVLLHRFVLAESSVATGVLSHTELEPSDTLYVLVEDAGAEGKAENPLEAPARNRRASRRTSVDESEWLYQMSKEPGKKWEVFNDAGKRWHRDGEAAAALFLDRADAEDEVVSTFWREARGAKMFDFTLERTSWQADHRLEKDSVCS